MESYFIVQKQSTRWGGPRTVGYVAALRPRAACSPPAPGHWACPSELLPSSAAGVQHTLFQQELQYGLVLFVFLLSSVSFFCDGQILFLGHVRQVWEPSDGRKFFLDFFRLPNNLCDITSFLPMLYLAQHRSVIAPFSSYYFQALVSCLAFLDGLNAASPDLLFVFVFTDTCRSCIHSGIQIFPHFLSIF